MRLVKRDMRTFWYASYNGRTMLMDGDYVTGERSTTLGNPVEAKGTFSIPTGAATPREFGMYIDYDFILHMEEKPCPFDENAAIWYKADPTKDDPDYRVVRIADSATHTVVAIREVR